MPRPCPHIEGFECPIMPGLECPSIPVPAGTDGKLAACRMEALAAGYLTHDATGRFDRKEGWRPGEEPQWRVKPH